MRRSVKDKFGEAAAFSLYDVSCLHSSLWAAILECSADADVSRRIMSKRSQLQVSIIDKKISFDLSALSDVDLKYIDLDKVAALLELQYNHFDSEEYFGADDLVTSEQVTPQVDRAALLNEIKKTGRQEQRVVMLIEAMLRDLSVGTIMFNEYKKDRGKYASWVLERLRAEFFLDNENVIDFDPKRFKSEDIEGKIAVFVKEMYLNIFPLNRGFLIFSFLKYFRHYPRINEAVKTIINKSNNSDVAWYVSHFKERFGPL